MDPFSRRRLLQLGVASAALLGADRARAAAAETPASDGGSAASLDEVSVEELQARMASGAE